MNNSDVATSIMEKLFSLEKVESIEEQERISWELATLGNEAIPTMIQFTQLYPLKFSRLEIIAHIVDLMGYPANRNGIPFLLDVIANINHPGWEIAASALNKIGEPILPDVRKALQYYLQNPEEYQYQIQGLCVFFELQSPGLIKLFIPDLLILLENGTDTNFVDLYALYPLIKIGSPDADLALPYIQKIIISDRSDHLRAFSIKALRHFDPKIVSAYIQIVEECLEEESIQIHFEALLTLEWLKHYVQ